MAQMILKIVTWRVIQIDGLNVSKNSNMEGNTKLIIYFVFLYVYVRRVP